jgi:8-oxo-dGTP pyrophosphatase MutT (NUDIX family)
MLRVEAGNSILCQAGVIACKGNGSKTKVLLITSRNTGRWIVPRGNIRPGSTPAKSAENEAYEEAGIKGTIVGPRPLGFYGYLKKLDVERTLAARVEVYLLNVTEQLKKWPEKGERRRSWVSINEAIGLVEPGVAALLRRLREILPSHGGRGISGGRRRRPAAA